MSDTVTLPPRGVSATPTKPIPDFAPKVATIRDVWYSDAMWQLVPDLGDELTGGALSTVVIRLDVNGNAYDQILAQIDTCDGPRQLEVLDEAASALTIMRDRLATLYGVQA